MDLPAFCFTIRCLATATSPSESGGSRSVAEYRNASRVAPPSRPDGPRGRPIRALGLVAPPPPASPSVLGTRAAPAAATLVAGGPPGGEALQPGADLLDGLRLGPAADASYPEARAGERARASDSLSHATQNQRPIPTEQHANAGTSLASSLMTVGMPHR